jgi:glycosyltransferase involved in cell wall biosynthesis
LTARPLDLLYIGTLPPHPGGTAIAMSQILAGLAARGHAVRTISPTVAGERDPFAERHPDLSVHRYVLPFLDTTPDTPNADEYHESERAAIVKIGSALVEERRPALLVAGRESFLPSVHDLASLHELPVVAFAQGSTTHALADRSYPPELAADLLERFRQADLRVTPAQHMADSMRLLGVPDFHVVPNPVDLTRFHPRPRDPALAAELGIGRDEVVLAHFSNLIPVKRPLDLAAAAPLALAHEPRLLFLIVGDGPLRAELEAAAGPAERFRFVDWVEFDDVPTYLSVADLVVQPSAAEGQALIYLEAQATGLTVVASDIPSARDVIDDGKTGLLYPVGDIERFAEAIVRAAGDPELRARLGRRAMSRVQRHALPDIVTLHEELLARV